MKLAVIALWTVLGVAVASFPASAEIAGQYVVNGHEPNSGGNYKGEAAVKKEGTTYHIMWVIGQQVSIGTGILSDKTLSITYMTRGSPVPGLAVYNVEPDGTLVGRFTLLGSKQMGAEAWTPIER